MPAAVTGRAGRAGLLAGSLLAGIAVGEVGLRIGGVSSPAFHRPDARLGSVLEPGVEGWWRREQVSFVRINETGFRGRAPEVAKPAGTYRVAVLGDSFTEALQIGEGDTFWAVLERRLASDGRRPEVLAFGVSGYGPAEELLLLRDRVFGYAPDLVVLAMFTGNDVGDCHPGLSHWRRRPYFRLRDGALELDDSFRRSRSFVFRSHPVVRWLRRHSLIVQLANAAATRLSELRRQSRRPEEGVGLPWPIQGREALYRPPADGAWREAWEVAEAVLRTMAAESAEHGARFLVVTLPNPEQVTPDPAVRDGFAHALGVADLSYADRRIAELGRAADFPVLNLAPALAAYATAHRSALHFDVPGAPGGGHWNETGHRVAGELIADYVVASGLVPRSQSE